MLYCMALVLKLSVNACRFGYDAFSLSEATMGDVMQQAGYMTAHYGKW